MKNPNGPSIEQIDDWHDTLMDEAARGAEAVQKAVCTVCREAWVDVMNGEDTCPDCLGKV